MLSRGSTFLLCFWMGLILLFTYTYTYPYDLLSKLQFAQAHTESVPAFWAFNWHLTHLVTGDLDQLFTGNLFYPLEDSVLFNENLLSTALLSIPLFWLTGDSYLCYEASIFGSFILCSLGMYLLARQLGLDILASILASLIFSFSEYRSGTFIYGHYAAMQWMPFTLLFIHKYFDQKKRGHLYLAALFFGLQATASATYFILFSLFLLAFLIILCVQNKSFRSKSFYADAAPPFFLA